MKLITDLISLTRFEFTYVFTFLWDHFYYYVPLLTLQIIGTHKPYPRSLQWSRQYHLSHCWLSIHIVHLTPPGHHINGGKNSKNFFLQSWTPFLWWWLWWSWKWRLQPWTTWWTHWHWSRRRPRMSRVLTDQHWQKLCSKRQQDQIRFLWDQKIHYELSSGSDLNQEITSMAKKVLCYDHTSCIHLTVLINQ